MVGITAFLLNVDEIHMPILMTNNNDVDSGFNNIIIIIITIF